MNFTKQPVIGEIQSAKLELERYKDYLKIQASLRKLPAKYQEVIALKYFEEKKIREIGVILNKKEGTVKSLLSRGLEQLKNLSSEKEKM
jgi:RNA polymerase sigma-70 factor (ECF subfamily)